MSCRKDLKSKPKEHRFFPLRFGDAVRLVKDLSLTRYDDSRIAIRMENYEGEAKFGFPILDYVPGEEVVIYSLSDSMNEDLAKKSTILALAKLSDFKARQADSRHDSYFCAYLKNNTIILTRIDRTFKYKKYRGNDKLSNRFVGSNVKEILLEEINEAG